MNMLSPILNAARYNWLSLMGWGLIFAVGCQVLQLVLLMIRFGDAPNYAITYDWLANASWIISSTPSIKDVFPILFEEWWIEIGFMNYDFGNGISEWSLNVIPSRLLMLALMGALLKLLHVLLTQTSCTLKQNLAVFTGAGLGTLLMSMTSAAMSWVVCCATPSWVVGLAMLGLSVSASLALEGLGPLLFYVGIGFLLSAVVLSSIRISLSQAEGERVGLLTQAKLMKTFEEQNEQSNNAIKTVGVRT